MILLFVAGMIDAFQVSAKGYKYLSPPSGDFLPREAVASRTSLLEFPLFFEVNNTWAWLRSLSDKYGKPITLSNIPNEEIILKMKDSNIVWLCGVWERSPLAREEALNDETLYSAYQKTLSNYTDADVVGSPYAVYRYRVDPYFGGNEALAVFRAQLAEHGIQLWLDYVPNHMASDSPWIPEDPDMFIQGTLEDMNSSADVYFLAGSHIVAHGRNSYIDIGDNRKVKFQTWSDTAQIKVFSKKAREKATSTLIGIDKLCDGVRCDMAMLMEDEIVQRTWGSKAGIPLPQSFWEEVIPAVHTHNPHFKFMAEVYWGMQKQLINKGFDYCYDKELYDLLKEGDCQKIRGHLRADADYQRKLLRFIEIHDEPRARAFFGDERSRAAAIIVLTSPSARLIHSGQMEGHRIHVPVQLGRYPEEPDDENFKRFYSRLIEVAPPGRSAKNPQWKGICDVEGIDDNQTHLPLIAYQWIVDGIYQVIVVNYSDSQAQGHVRIKEIQYGEDPWFFYDALNDQRYAYEGKDLAQHGLYIKLAPRQGHIFYISQGDKNSKTAPKQFTRPCEAVCL